MQALDRASATRLRDQVDGRGVARIAVGGSRGAEGYEAAALALRRGRDLARLAGTPEDSVEILFQPSLPPDTARVFIGAV